MLPTLVDGPIVLRAVRPSDRVDRMAAGQDRQFLRMLGGDERRATARLSEEAADAWYGRLRDGRHWVIEWNGHCVGNAGLSRWDEPHRYATYSIAIFAADARGRGIGTAVTRTILRYVFDVAHLHRVDLRVLEFNERAIHCYERCGFVREGVERETALVDGRYRNDLRMRILEQEYRALPRSTRG
ncbi:MAG: GNAT family protein [Candidatus Dormiibacterota bacterium]